MSALLSDGDNFKTIECPECFGSGTRTYAVRSYGGRLTGEEETRDCETCGGDEVITVKVHSCGREESGDDPCRCFESAEEAKVA